MKPEELDKLEALARAATPGPRVMSPRHVMHYDRIAQGADWEQVASQADPEEWLGWECKSGFYSPGRGDFSGPDAVFLAATDPQKILTLIDNARALTQRITQLEQDCRDWQKDRDSWRDKFVAADAEVARLGRAVAVQPVETIDCDEFRALMMDYAYLSAKASEPTSFDMYDKRLAIARAALIAYIDARLVAAGMAQWVSVGERLPEVGVSVIVYSPPTQHDWPNSLNIEFDCIDPDGDGTTWLGHNENYEHFCCVAKPEGSIGPSEKAPYTHWMALPARPQEQR